MLPLDFLLFPNCSGGICSSFIAWLKWASSASCMCLRFSAFIIPARHFGFSHRMRNSADAFSRFLLSYDPFPSSSLKIVIVRIFVFAGSIALLGITIQLHPVSVTGHAKIRSLESVMGQGCTLKIHVLHSRLVASFLGAVGRNVTVVEIHITSFLQGSLLTSEVVHSRSVVSEFNLM